MVQTIEMPADLRVHEMALEHFIRHQGELCEKYNGKELLMRGAEVVGAFDTLEDAWEEGCKLFGAGNFSLQTCIPGKEAYTVEVVGSSIVWS